MTVMDGLGGAALAAALLLALLGHLGAGLMVALLCIAGWSAWQLTRWIDEEDERP